MIRLVAFLAGLWLATAIPADPQNFTQLVDHFSTSYATFEQRLLIPLPFIAHDLFVDTMKTQRGSKALETLSFVFLEEKDRFLLRLVSSIPSSQMSSPRK